VYKKIKNNLGISLIEIVVAVTLFSVVIILALQIFKSIVEGQRSSIAAQDIQENMKYFFEVISKEMRMAQGAHEGIDCGVTPYYKVFNTNASGTDDDELYFENKNGDCVVYQLGADNRLYINRGGSGFEPVTPDEIIITNLLFHVEDDQSGAFKTQQPTVTIMLDAEVVTKDLHKQEIKMQTTISSRYYE